MIIVFIVMMAVGLLAFAASFFLSDGKEKTSSVVLKSSGSGDAFDEDESIIKTNGKEESKATDAIEAAKKKAREAVNKDYQFDLHLTKDTSNQTVEELERDLLGGLDLSDNVELAEETVEVEKPAPASNSSKNNSSKKKNRKKNAPKNDRYDDLLYEDVTKEEEKAESAPKAQTSKNNKKGKKK